MDWAHVQGVLLSTRGLAMGFLALVVRNTTVEQDLADPAPLPLQ
jgi:hypothetical protein